MDRTQFQIPDYLLADRGNIRRFDYESVGTGIIWLGLFLIAVPAATSNLSPLSIASWAAGFILVAAGVIRARVDQHSMMRAGALTAAAGALSLMIIANQIVRHQVERSVDQDAGANAIAAETAEAGESGEGESQGGLAMSLTGSMPMLRGSPEHTGVQPGPGIEGNPYRVWRFDTGEDLRSTPAIANATAYFGTRDGYLVALDLLTGLPRWRFDLGGYPVRSAPAIVDRTVYVGSGYAVFAIDAERGIERWRFSMSYAGESSPTVVDGTVYVASKENHLYALDAATGEKIWSYKTEGLLFGSPSVSGDFVVIGGDDGDVFAVDRATGRMIWRFEASGGVYSTPAIQDDVVYVTTKNRTVTALDLATGLERWSYPVGGDASPAISDETVYIGSDDGAVYAIDAQQGGTPKWLFATGNGALLSPVVVGDSVYVAAGATITNLDRATGEMIWQYPVGDTLTTQPVVLDGFIYAGARDGYLYAITGDAAIGTPPASEESENQFRRSTQG